MNLFDDSSKLVVADFSFGLSPNGPTIIVESKGGSPQAKNQRNPDYNQLVRILLVRLCANEVAINGVYLESGRFSDQTEQDRMLGLSIPYPITLAGRDLEKLRTEIGNELSKTFQKPGVTKGGSYQKRFRLDISKTISPDLVLYPDGVRVHDEELQIQELAAKSTTVMATVQARVGQGNYRQDLLKKFNSSCAVTGISQTDFLIASHVKPWKVSNNEERIDPDNGLLLMCNYDKAFDKGYITFDANGRIMISARLDNTARDQIGLSENATVKIGAETEEYMNYHRTFVYRR